MAIDDYIDPTKPLTISNKEIQNMKAVYETLRKQKEDERASIGVPKQHKTLKKGKSKPPQSPPRPGTSKKLPAKSKPKNQVQMNKTHTDDKGWNTDTRTTGEFDSLRKNALKKDEDTVERRAKLTGTNKPVKKKDSLEQVLHMEFKQAPKQNIYFTDLEQVHQHLDQADDKNLKLATGNKILQLQQLEKALKEE